MVLKVDHVYPTHTHLGSQETVRKMGGWIVVDVFTNKICLMRKKLGCYKFALKTKEIQLKFEAA